MGFFPFFCLVRRASTGGRSLSLRQRLRGRRHNKQNFARLSFNSMSLNPRLFPISPCASWCHSFSSSSVSLFHRFLFVFFTRFDFGASLLQDVWRSAGFSSAARGRRVLTIRGQDAHFLLATHRLFSPPDSAPPHSRQEAVSKRSKVTVENISARPQKSDLWPQTESNFSSGSSFSFQLWVFPSFQNKSS